MLTQRDIIQEIKQVKWELRQHCSPENLTKLYNWIDRLEVPQEPMTPTNSVGNPCGGSYPLEPTSPANRGGSPFTTPDNPCGGLHDDIRLSGYNSTRE